MSRLLTTDDVAGARRLLPSLCGRDPAALDASGLTRATVESLAENTSDAQVAPLFWAAIGGVPAVLVYRGANTLDAMIGHRSPRYNYFGWAAARFDDVLYYLPARVSGVLAVRCAPVVDGSPAAALRASR
nr:cobalamin biosynthesis protein [Streptomyces sp. DSM 41633]